MVRMALDHYGKAGGVSLLTRLVTHCGDPLTPYSLAETAGAAGACEGPGYDQEQREQRTEEMMPQWERFGQTH